MGGWCVGIIFYLYAEDVLVCVWCVGGCVPVCMGVKVGGCVVNCVCVEGVGCGGGWEWGGGGGVWCVVEGVCGVWWGGCGGWGVGGVDGL